MGWTRALAATACAAVLQSMPVSCHFRGCKAPLFRIVSGAISSELALPLAFLPSQFLALTQTVVPVLPREAQFQPPRSRPIYCEDSNDKESRQCSKNDQLTVSTELLYTLTLLSHFKCANFTAFKLQHCWRRVWVSYCLCLKKTWSIAVFLLYDSKVGLQFFFIFSTIQTLVHITSKIQPVLANHTLYPSKNYIKIRNQLL